MAETLKLQLPLWDHGILEPDLVYNEALDLLDLFVGLGVKSRTVTAQPGSPTEGDAYILPATHTGAAWGSFAQHDIAVYRNAVWVAVAPRGRIVAEVDDEGVQVTWTGTTWSVRTTTLKVNYTATTNPTVNDDSGDGYGIGSTWVNTTLDKWFVCTDATVGAAVWATGGGISGKYKSTNYTALAGDTIHVDSGAGAITITLPSTPVDGDYVAVMDGEGNAATNNITIDRNGNTIDGAATNFIIDVNNGRVDMVYSGAHATWEYQFALSAGTFLAADAVDAVLNDTIAGLPAFGNRLVFNAGSLYDGTTPADFGAFTRVEASASGPTYGYRTASGTVDQEGQWVHSLTERYNVDTHGFKFQVIWIPTTTGAGDVKFEMSLVGVGDGDEITNAFVTGATVVDSCQLSTTKVHVTPLSAAFTLTTSQFKIPGIYHGRLRRLATDGADTYANDIRILGYLLHASPRAMNDNNGNDF